MNWHSRSTARRRYTRRNNTTVSEVAPESWILAQNLQYSLQVFVAERVLLCRAVRSQIANDLNHRSRRRVSQMLPDVGESVFDVVGEVSFQPFLESGLHPYAESCFVGSGRRGGMG